MWALWALQRIEQPRLLSLLDDPAPALRCWALRLLSDAWPLDTVLGDRPTADERPSASALDALERLAIAETDPEVRLTLACVVSRLPPIRRARIAAELVAKTEFGNVAVLPVDPADPAPRALGGDHHDLGAMLWVGLLPAFVTDPDGVIGVWRAACVPGAQQSHWPSLRRAIARRMTGSDAAAARPDLLAAAAEEGPAGFEDCLAGLDAGWRGRHQVDRPTGWTDLRAAIGETPDGAPRRGPLLDAAARLDALFGDPRGIDRLADTARDAGFPPHVRAAALDALVDVKADEARHLAQGLLLEPGLSLAAIRSLLATGADEDARRIVDAYPRLDEAHRDAALSALAARVSWGGILIDGVEDGRIPNTAITPLLTRQLAGLGDPLLRSRLAALGPPPTAGHVVSTADVVSTRLDAWKARLSPQILAGGDPAAGRGVWQKQCAACHRMHGEGGSLGPDLTGSGRRDLDYLLANIVTPSATVSPDYRMKQVVLADGRVLSGIVIRRTAELLLLRTQTGEEAIPVDDVDEVIDGGVSLMPEGILDRLDEAEVADLFRFLMEP